MDKTTSLYKNRNKIYFYSYDSKKTGNLHYVARFYAYDHTSDDIVKYAIGFQLSEQTRQKDFNGHLKYLKSGLDALYRSAISVLKICKYHEEHPKIKCKTKDHQVCMDAMSEAGRKCLKKKN